MSISVSIHSEVVTLYPTSDQVYVLTVPTGQKALSVGWYTTQPETVLHRWSRPVSDTTWELCFAGSKMPTNVPISLTLYITYTS